MLKTGHYTFPQSPRLFGEETKGENQPYTPKRVLLPKEDSSPEGTPRLNRELYTRLNIPGYENSNYEITIHLPFNIV